MRCIETLRFGDRLWRFWGKGMVGGGVGVICGMSEYEALGTLGILGNTVLEGSGGVRMFASPGEVGLAFAMRRA